MLLKPKEAVRFDSQKGEAMTSKIQGQDAIIVAVPIERMWPLISNSLELCNWGPPVREVKILTENEPEGLGTWRRVEAEFNGQQGHFIERRIEHIEGRKIAILIEEETFGLFRLMSEVGSSLELAPVDANQTRVTFTFFHNPKGILGYVMNQLVILRQQRRNRLAALASLKKYAEQSGRV